MKLLIVDPEVARRTRLIDALGQDHDLEVLVADDTLDVLERVGRFQPDMVIVACETPARDSIEDLRRVSESTPRPIVMLVDKAGQGQVEAALRAGVAAYVVEGLEPSRIGAILELASAQFRVMQDLRRDLDRARIDLANRKIIDRAKGLIMKRRQIDEPAAYALLRKAAMDQGKSIAAIAAGLLDAEALLGDDP